MRLQKSRSYLINDWLCNCCFEARRAPPSAMGFLDDLGASGLMSKRRACHGTQCLIHQPPPAQSSRSIPAPTPGPLPGGAGLGTTLPGLFLLRSSPKMLAFHPPCWALKEAASEACQRPGRRPRCARTPTGLPQPHTTPRTHTPSPGRGTQVPRWDHCSGSECLKISTHAFGAQENKVCY